MYNFQFPRNSSKPAVILSLTISPNRSKNPPPLVFDLVLNKGGVFCPPGLLRYNYLQGRPAAGAKNCTFGGVSP